LRGLASHSAAGAGDHRDLPVEPSHEERDSNTTRANRHGLKDFKEFLLRGNLVDTALGIVIGLAFAAVITALVADLITSLIAAIGGNPDFSALTFTINGSHFLYRSFINALITFVVIAAVIFFLVVKPVNALMERGARSCRSRWRRGRARRV